MSRYGLSGEPRGVGVREVVKDSPAERAGIRANDVILRFDGEPVTSLRKLNRLIDESSPEHQARLAIRRGGSEQEITVKLGKREMGRLLGEGDWGKQSEEWRRFGDEMRKQGTSYYYCEFNLTGLKGADARRIVWTDAYEVKVAR